MAGRVIFHIDLNAFFANAEILKYPQYKDKPLVVAGLHRRSVVCAANYEARKYGVQSAMPLMMAQEKCKDLIIVAGNHSYYEEISQRFFRYLQRFTNAIEIASIDECYMDVTDIIKKFKRPMDLAWMIQKSIYDDLGLPCSIGVAPNKFLAKMASDMRKPMGITILRKQEIQKKLWPLPIEEMWGIGKKSIPNLKANGIETIGDLTKPEYENFLLRTLGKQGYSAISHAKGNGSNQLVYSSSISSLSQSTTLDKDITDYDEVKQVFKSLAISLSKRAQSEGVKGAMISISIRYYDFTNMVRSLQINTYTNDYNIILEHALYLFDRHYNGAPIRHLGIGLASFFNQESGAQMNLFEEVIYNDTEEILKELNKAIPNASFIKASALLNQQKKHR